MDEKKLREQGYIRIDKFCEAMDTWAQVCQEELPDDGEHTLWFRTQFREHWKFIRLAIAKSCLLDRLIYGGEDICECQHDTCITGWIPNPGDPKSQASFTVTLLSKFLKDNKA